MAGLQDMAPMVANAMRDERGLRAHARGRRRGLAAGMAAADHDDVEALIVDRCAIAGYVATAARRGQNNRDRRQFT